MRDPSHMKKVEQWAEYVRDHPHEWRKQVNPLINSQITKARRFYEILAKTPNGMEKIRQIKENKTRN